MDPSEIGTVVGRPPVDDLLGGEAEPRVARKVRLPLRPTLFDVPLEELHQFCPLGI